MRRLDFRATIEAGIGIAHVVGKDVDDVGISGGCLAHLVRLTRTHWQDAGDEKDCSWLHDEFPDHSVVTLPTIRFRKNQFLHILRTLEPPAMAVNLQVPADLNTRTRSGDWKPPGCPMEETV